MTIEIRPLDEDTIIAEACCIGGRRSLDKESTLTEREQIALRAAEMKADWLRKMVPRGLSAKIAYEEQEPIGFIEYMPIELSNFHNGKDLYIINCMVAPHTPPWGGPHKERVPSCGSSLVQAMIDDVTDKCKGIVSPFGFAYTENLEEFFARFGFEEFENDGLKMLILRFESVELPTSVHYERKYQFKQAPGKVVVDIFWSSMCPADPYTLLNVRAVCAELGDRMILNEFCVDNRKALMEHGIKSGTYVNGKYPWSTYGPLEKDEIRGVLREVLAAKNLS